MALHTVLENKLFSAEAHGLFNEEYDNDIQKMLGKLQILKTSLEKYQQIPLHRKSERRKQSFTLFNVYWQNVLKILLPYIREAELNNLRLFMRYGLFNISSISVEDCETLAKVALHTERPSLIYYIDEWFHNVANGNINIISEKDTQIKSTAKKTGYNSNLKLINEATSLKEIMAKLCSASKCMATPFLHKDDLSRKISQQISSREAVQKIINLVKNIDPQVFVRKLLKETIRLEPYVVLVPSYSNFGTCWKAYDRLERTTSRGRVVIPLYSVNTHRSVLIALANYRWETAKLSAGNYWLEKGLTGGFYDLYRKHRLPGENEQQAFVDAYCQWILDESHGQIRLNSELRRFFWREIPFEENRAKMLVRYFAQFRDL